MPTKYVSNADIKADHICGCVRCDITASIFNLTGVQGAMSLRDFSTFWEQDWNEGKRVLLDGVQVQGVIAVILGDNGFLWRYRGVPKEAAENKHLCVTCQDKLMEKGLVESGHFVYIPTTDGRGRRITTEPEICCELLRGKVEFRMP